MIKNPCNFICLFALIILSGCVSGSHIVTGTPRTPTVWQTVKIYHTAPDKSEIIGIVTAPFSGTSQGQTDYSVELLKKTAARIGANGIVIGSVQSSPGTSSFGMVGSSPVFLSTPGSSTMQGTAIFVP